MLQEATGPTRWDTARTLGLRALPALGLIAAVIGVVTSRSLLWLGLWLALYLLSDARLRPGRAADPAPRLQLSDELRRRPARRSEQPPSRAA